MDGEYSVKPRILIVDDESGIRAALSRWFKIRGFEVEEAENGLEAIEKCLENDYDVVTMDLEMPGMGGLEAIVVIKESYPALPIVVLTGYVRDSEAALNNGAAKVLTKPLRLKELEEEVRELLS